MIAERRYVTHFFPALSKKTAGELAPWLKPDELDEAYHYWVDRFYSKAHMFYAVQLQNHARMLTRQFYALNGLNPDDTYDLDDDWQEQVDAYFEREGYNVHLERYEAAIGRLERMRANEHLDDGITATSTEPDVTFFIRLMESAQRGERHPYFASRRFDELWFNQIIDNEPVDVEHLRRMPYKEYLQTPHWKRVRAAMILIHRCRCQGKHCVGTDGYWLGDEDLVHVHHVSYANRGRERFQDLRLLCAPCHELLHIQGADEILPESKLSIATL